MEKIAQLSAVSRSRKDIQKEYKCLKMRHAKIEKDNNHFLTNESITANVSTSVSASFTQTTAAITTTTAAITTATTTSLSTENISESPSRLTSPVLTQEIKVTANTNIVISDMQRNIHIQKNHRRWSKTTLSIFAVLFLTSFAAFIRLGKSLCIPSKNTMYRFVNSFKALDIERITEVSKVKELLIAYKRENNIDDNVFIPGVLSVDAVSLTPHITIDNNGKIKGIKKNTDFDISNEDIASLKDLIKEQEKLIEKLKKETINNAFVYYFQPLDPTYRCFPVYIMGESSGKAGKKQSEMLEILSGELKKYNFVSLFFAADGDTGYQKYVTRTVNKWNTGARPILNFEETLFSNDVLHLIKRGRYRYLSHELVMMNKDSQPINKTAVQEVLNLPSSVFDNSKVTKMQDSLPLKLFNLESFLVLEEKRNFIASAYFLPFTLLTTAITAKNIDINARVDLLEITAHYLQIFKIVFDNTDEAKRGMQQGKSNCVLFNNRLIDDLLTTVLSINTCLNTFSGVVSLNRIGTNPLEHHFGLLRIRCHFNHSYEKFIKEEAKINVLHEIEKEVIGNAVASRQSQVGETVILSNDEYGEKRYYSNREIAYACLGTFGLNVSSVKIRDTISNCFIESAYLEFIKILNDVHGSSPIKKRKFVLNSKNLGPTGASGALIRQRQESASIIKKAAQKCISESQPLA